MDSHSPSPTSASSSSLVERHAVPGAPDDEKPARLDLPKADRRRARKARQEQREALLGKLTSLRGDPVLIGEPMLLIMGRAYYGAWRDALWDLEDARTARALRPLLTVHVAYYQGCLTFAQEHWARRHWLVRQSEERLHAFADAAQKDIEFHRQLREQSRRGQPADYVTFSDTLIDEAQFRLSAIEREIARRQDLDTRLPL